jgi:hypothetical protein
MAESCLDDEFNPGSCDLDIGAAVATFPNSEEIDAFAFSGMSPDYMGYYNVWPGVEVNLFKGGDDFDANRADGPDGYAMRNVSDPISTGAIYTDVATPYTCYYNENGVKGCDPVWNYQVAAVESTAAPSISSLSPPSAVPGSSGTLTINGANLLNIFDPSGQPQVTSSGSGVTLSSPPTPSPASTSVQVNYSIAGGATPGSYDVTASNNWGASNAAVFTVASDATVQSQNKATPKLAATVTPLVTNAGCGGGEISNPTRIIRVSRGNILVGSYPTGDIECMTPPTNVMAGELIGLDVPPFYVGKDPTTGDDIWGQVQSLTWTISDCTESTCATKTNTVNAVGNYTASAASGKVQLIKDVDMTQNPIFFYFTVPGHYEEVDVTVTFIEGSTYSTYSAWARFYVGGPTGNLLLTPSMITGTGSSDTGVQVLAGPKLSTTGISVGTSQVGITFKSNATPPSGYNQSFTWVQIISGVQNKYINSTGQFSTPSSPQSGIDNTYPYANASSTSTNDTPSTALPSIYGEGWESFTATMFLMWDPALPNKCTPASTNSTTLQSTASNCTSIPIPLSSVIWHWSGCAVNTLANQTNGTTWSLSTGAGCPVQTLGTPQSAGFPTWTSQVVRSY